MMMNLFHTAALVAKADSDPERRQGHLEAAEFELKWALRDVREARGTSITKDGKHQCENLPRHQFMVTRKRYLWTLTWNDAAFGYNEAIPVTHCPWCGTLLEPMATMTATDGPRVEG